MSSAMAAKTLTRELGEMLAPTAGWQQQVTAVHRKLTSEHFAWAIRDLTWSRVKTWFYGEARRIDYDEMIALKELKATEEARREHLQFLASTNLVAAALAAEGETFTRRQMEILARVQSRSDHVEGHPDAGSRGTVRGMAAPGASK